MSTLIPATKGDNHLKPPEHIVVSALVRAPLCDSLSSGLRLLLTVTDGASDATYKGQYNPVYVYCAPKLPVGMPTSADTLHALIGLISTSLNEVISAYQNAGHNAPSLDSVEPGPLDSPQNTPLNVTKAVHIIEGACAQLCATIAPPGHSVFNVSVRRSDTALHYSCIYRKDCRYSTRSL